MRDQAAGQDKRKTASHLNNRFFRTSSIFRFTHHDGGILVFVRSV